MPFEFLLSNHNITHDDIVMFDKNDVITPGRWTHEEVQLIVLGSLLLLIIFGFVVVATMDCVRQKCCQCFWRKRIGDRWKAPQDTSLAPPPYSSSPALPTIA